MTNSDAITVLDRVRGMLMHLWALVQDQETRQAIHETIGELGQVEDKLVDSEA